jgi:hypothetical protein
MTDTEDDNFNTINYEFSQRMPMPTDALLLEIKNELAGIRVILDTILEHKWPSRSEYEAWQRHRDDKMIERAGRILRGDDRECG